MRRIDVSHFECPGCGHLSTPPEEINTIPHQMETYEEIEAIHVPKPEDEQIFKQTLEQYHYGNDFDIQPIQKPDADKIIPEPLKLKPELAPKLFTKRIQVQRSYAEVKEQSSTLLEESDHIVLSCPQCHQTLYEVNWRT